jgi:hypothetical protein
MKFVRLQYVGKKPSLHLTMPRLRGEYTFDKGNEMTVPVEYGDASYLLGTSVAIFKVVGGPFESVEPSTLTAQEVPNAPGPIVLSDDPNEDTIPAGTLTGDGVEGTGPLPPPEEPTATSKKGKK